MSYTNSTDPGANIIDFRDITDRVEELRSERDNHGYDWEGEPKADADTPEQVDAQRASWADGYPADAAELAQLETLLDETRGYGGNHDWEGNWYPLLLVADSHFEDFAQEEAFSLGLINADVGWPYTCIDWAKATEELKKDYSSITYGGVDYWYR